MEGFASGFDFSPLIGREIYALDMTRFFMYFMFVDEDNKLPLRIEFTADVILTDQNGEIAVVDDFSKYGNQICSFIGTKIERASRRNDGGLKLGISDGRQLDIPNDVKNYETCVIHLGEKSFVA